MTTQAEIVFGYLQVGVLLWALLLFRNWSLAMDLMRKNGVKTPLVMILFVVAWLPLVCAIAFRRQK